MTISPLPRFVKGKDLTLFVMRRHVHNAKFEYLYSKYQLKFFRCRNNTIASTLNKALLAYKEATIPDLKIEYSVMIWVLMHEMAYRDMPL